MRAQAIVLPLIGAIGLLVFASGCMARQRSWDGDVRRSPDGRVCFSIENDSVLDSDVVRVAAIIVSELDERERVSRTTWTADFTRSNPPAMLSAGTCIPYATHDSVRTVGQVIPVEPGRRYSVFINADIKNGADWDNRGYGAFFCISEDSMQRRVIHEVHWNEATERRHWDVCGLDSSAGSISD